MPLRARARGREPRRPRRARARRCSCRSSCPGGCDLLDTLRADRAVRHATPTCAARLEASTARRALGRHRRSACTRRWRAGRAAASRASSTRGKIGFLPGIDYANPDLSHFHSRHFWETGLVTERRRARLARPLARPPRLARQPAAGAVARLRRSRRCCAARRAPVAALESPERRRARRCGASAATATTQTLDTWARLGRARARAAPGPAAATTAARLAKHGRRPARALRRKHDGVDPLAPPVAYPEDNDLGRAAAHARRR